MDNHIFHGSQEQDDILEATYYQQYAPSNTMQRHRYRPANMMQRQPYAPAYATPARLQRPPPQAKEVNKTPLDYKLIRNGVIVWAYSPSEDLASPSPKPFKCCRTSGHHRCDQQYLNEGGFNHPFLVLEHYQTPGSKEEGDLTLKIIPITTFGGESILQAYSKTFHKKRMDSIPIFFSASQRATRPQANKLLEHLNKPLLTLETGATFRQLFLEVNHIYEVSVKELHAYAGKGSNGKYIRLDKGSFDTMRRIFGLGYDEGSFGSQVKTLSKKVALNPLAGEFKMRSPPTNNR